MNKFTAITVIVLLTIISAVSGLKIHLQPLPTVTYDSVKSRFDTEIDFKYYDNLDSPNANFYYGTITKQAYEMSVKLYKLDEYEQCSSVTPYATKDMQSCMACPVDRPLFQLGTRECQPCRPRVTSKCDAIFSVATPSLNNANKNTAFTTSESQAFEPVPFSTYTNSPSSTPTAELYTQTPAPSNPTDSWLTPTSTPEILTPTLQIPIPMPTTTVPITAPSQSIPTNATTTKPNNATTIKPTNATSNISQNTTTAKPTNATIKSTSASSNISSNATTTKPTNATSNISTNATTIKPTDTTTTKPTNATSTNVTSKTTNDSAIAKTQGSQNITFANQQCPKSTPYYNPSTKNCENCKDNEEYIATQRKCLPIIFISNPKTKYVILKEPDQLLKANLNITNSNPQRTVRLCPIDRPLAIKNQCIACPADKIFNFTSQDCQAGCPEGQLFSEANSQCIPAVFLTNSDATNLLSPMQDFEAFRSAQKQRVKSSMKIVECPLTKPIMLNGACSNCPADTPLFNIQSQVCQSCTRNRNYNSYTRRCEADYQSGLQIKRIVPNIF